jgi:AraC family transcriptional regulator
VGRNLGNVAATGPLARSARPAGEYLLARGAAFSAYDCVCHHGARSPTFEGAHARAHVSVILAGAFRARTREGTTVVGPGTLLLGNAAAPYEYRHVDDGGDRSIVFDYGEAMLADVDDARRAFRRVSVAASPASANVVALAQQAVWTGEPDAFEEAALAAAALALDDDAAGEAMTAPAIASAQARRVATTLRYVEAHFADDCHLATLAAVAGLSHFHFLRVFRLVTGQTPRQFVIATRLRAAASALRTTRVPITSVALDAGFGDLSNFIATFTRAFGASPRAYRRRHG